ncbi:MAG TPA: FAD-binding dehydrogenase [Burkholderiales bacterium]
MLKGEVVIIGGGLAGVVCALELLEAGRQVLLLDRDTEENFGGLARESFGGMFFVDTPEQRRAKFADSVDLALGDWKSFAQFGDDETWPQRWAEYYVHQCTPRGYHWLKSRGIGFFPVPHWVERGEFVRGNSVPRFHLVWGTGQRLAMVLIAHLQAHPQRARLDLRFGHRVERLVTTNGRVTGCAGALEAQGAPFEAQGEAVVVAAGGINGSIERVKDHWHADWGTPPETILNGSHRHADGRLHDAARAAGARLTHLDRMWNYAAGVHHWRPRKPRHGLSLVPPRSALWLDLRGRRILPPLVTGFDTRDLVTQVAKRGGWSWQLLNRRIALKELAVSGAEFNPSIRERRVLGFLRDLLLGNRWLYDQLTRHCEDVVLADSVEALAARMNALAPDAGVDAAALRATLEAHDAAVARGAPFEDPQLARIDAMRAYRGDRVRTARSQGILDPGGGPLIAIREFIISRKSLGGIQTDLQCRALDDSGAPVPGLYAIGEAAGFGGGGVHGLRALEGTFLGACVLTGRAAADTLAGRSG